MTNEEVVALLSEVNSRSKSNTHRLDEMEKRQDDLEELTSTVKVLAVREENVERDVKEIKADVKQLSEKPLKRGEGIVDKLIYALFAAVLTFLLTKIGIT